MGWFSTKKKKKFATVVQRMIPDESIVLSSKAAVTEYIFKGDASPSVYGKSLPDYIIEASMNALPAKFRRAYRFCKQGKHPYGLPKSSIAKEAVDITPNVKAYLESSLGHPVDIKYAAIDEPNYMHFVWKMLIDSYGYNPETNELGVLSLEKGFTCYLKTGQLNYAQGTIDSVLDMSYLDQWGVSIEQGKTFERVQDLNRPHISYNVDPIALDDYFRFTYTYEKLIPDTNPPKLPLVKSYDGLVVNGLAEKFSKVSITNTLGEIIVEGLVDELGKYSLTVDNPQPPVEDPPLPFVYAHTEVNVQVFDSAGLGSGTVLISRDYINPETLPDEGEDPTQTVFPTDAVQDFLMLDYFDTNDELSEEVSKSALYVMASYTYVEDGLTKLNWLTYEWNSGTIPELDILPSFSPSGGEFFPRLYSRLNAIRLDNDSQKQTPAYKPNFKLAKILGFDFEAWCKNLHENIEDVWTVQQMFMTLAVPINVDDKVTAEYLFRYFTSLYLNDHSPILVGNKVLLIGATDNMNVKSGLSQEIKDNVYTHVIDYSNIARYSHTGNIGAVGLFKSTYVKASTPYHSLQWQKGVNLIEEIRVYRLASKHMFNSGGTTVSGDDEALVVPLDRTIIPQMTSNELEILYGKSLHLFINVLKIIKTKWYQSGAFKIVMAVVAIVIAVASVGAGAPMAAYAYAALFAIATSVAVSLAMTLLTKLLIVVGVSSKFMGVVAVVVAVAAIAVGASGSVGNILKVSAEVLLQATISALQLTARLAAHELREIYDQIDRFSNYAKSKWEVLEEAKKMMIVGAPLDLSLLADTRNSVKINVGETPDTFITRTLGLGNIGVLSYDIVSSYVEASLALPNLEQTFARLNEANNNGNS